uniref:(northern house mosquito) hypothetical protein n=1 Tax=Culex pipiens TaxID=7175 RepID=A0A8D8BH84_CULPI
MNPLVGLQMVQLQILLATPRHGTLVHRNRRFRRPPGRFTLCRSGNARRRRFGCCGGRRSGIVFQQVLKNRHVGREGFIFAGGAGTALRGHHEGFAILRDNFYRNRSEN